MTKLADPTEDPVRPIGTDAAQRVVLIVDDAPENLIFLHSALEGHGYVVRIATSGAMALGTAREAPPDLILLDALMPGLDGFETCERLKGDLATRDIPVMFMTGLAQTDDVVRGFRAGGIDYVTKPVREAELLARIAAHLRSRQRVDDARRASDAAGDAIISVDPRHRLQWATPLARRWLQPLLDEDDLLPDPLRRWLDERALSKCSVTVPAGTERLVFSLLHDDHSRDQLLLIRRQAAVPEPAVFSRVLRITAREGEVLYWVALGKTTPDIAEILQSSPRTINKHLEHIYIKLGVETRTAAATLALNRIRLLA